MERISRESLADTLAETVRRKDAFLALLAHELRNPLAPISNAVEIMRLKETENPDLVWCRDVIDRQSKRLKRLVDDLLDISRMTQGEIHVEKAPVAVSAILERAIECARPAIDAKHHHLAVEQPLHPIYVEGDLVRLAQAVGNLLDNAAKYTDAGGRIRIAAEELPGADGAAEVMILVRDSGAGIASEALPHVFDMFAQGGWTPDRTQGGLGIGLTLAARLVQLHGGSVTARSEGLGKGSEFEIRLPLIAGGPAREKTRAGARATASDDSAQRVLVVDDDADAARSLAVLLEASGNAVEIAYDGAEAVATADDFRPDVVLLDIDMPKLDGFCAARWIRGQSWARNVLLVALTGWGRDDVKSQVLESGFDAHMAKPADFAALSALFAKLPSWKRSGLVASR
jgi:CheY-like chemotaxis protein/nitrogen-specific signal transduction histidine kinase